MQKDIRKSGRYDLHQSVTLYESQNHAFIGCVVNLSSHGLLVVSDTPFHTSVPVSLQMEFARPNGAWARYRIIGWPTWSKPADDGTYHIGIHFLPISPGILAAFDRATSA